MNLVPSEGRAFWCYCPAMQLLHLFYSWQSDCGSKVCLNFNRHALEAAVANLKYAHGLEIYIDSDRWPRKLTVLKRVLIAVYGNQVIAAAASELPVAERVCHLNTAYDVPDQTSWHIALDLLTSEQPTSMPITALHFKKPIANRADTANIATG